MNVCQLCDRVVFKTKKGVSTHSSEAHLIQLQLLGIEPEPHDQISLSGQTLWRVRACKVSFIAGIGSRGTIRVGSRLLGHEHRLSENGKYSANGGESVAHA